LKNVYPLSWNLIGVSGLEMEKENENLFSSIARVINIHTTAKQVISRHRLDENGCEMSKHEIRTF